MSADRSESLVVAARNVQESCLLIVDGVLDSSTYLSLRDRIIKAALDEPPVLIVDVTGLRVPAESAWAVFTSARWHIGQWPDIPLALVCAHARGRESIVHNGVVRYVPVYETVAEAITDLAAQSPPRYRRRARVDLPAAPSSVSRARDLVAEWLTVWSRADLIAVAKLVVTVLVENVLAHTESAPSVRLESKGDAVTVAVEDGNPTPAARRERSRAGVEELSGLAILTALCRTWGNAPTSSGKTVWAVMGPENQL